MALSIDKWRIEKWLLELKPKEINQNSPQARTRHKKDKKTNKGAIFIENKVVILALNRSVTFPHTKPYIFAVM